eukprot:104362-Pelagomonas_calceolata.AAC.17
MSNDMVCQVKGSTGELSRPLPFRCKLFWPNYQEAGVIPIQDLQNEFSDCSTILIRPILKMAYEVPVGLGKKGVEH